MWIVLMAAVVIFAQHPSKPPERQRAAKSKSSQVGKQTQGTTDNNNGPNQTPNQTFIFNQNPAPHSNANQSEADQSAGIQGRIQTYTGLLVLVGFLQVGVMVLQWLIYHRQAGILTRQTDLMEGGLHVDGVRVIEFQAGREPIFFVKIMNSGMAAKQVRISMKIELNGSTSEYLRDQVITIPANDGRECFLRFAHILNEGHLLELERGNMSLRVSGHAAWPKQTVEYCYKYNAWPYDNRPPELPPFVACDFDTRIAAGAVAKITALPGLRVEIGEVTARGESSEVKPSKEPTEPN